MYPPDDFPSVTVIIVLGEKKRAEMVSGITCL